MHQESAFTLSSGWERQTCACWSTGADVVSTRAGASATCSSRGSVLALIGGRSTVRGSADVVVDGTRAATVDEHTASTAQTLDRNVIFTERLVRGQHTVEVVSRTATGFGLDAVVHDGARR